MLDLSPAGLLGAIVGTAVAGLVYGRLAGILTRSLRARATGQPYTVASLQDH